MPPVPKPPKATSQPTVEIFIDGASQGNPGPAGIGIAIQRGSDGATAQTLFKYIGTATNNVAEYTALIYAVQEALIRGYRDIVVKTDSELLAKQIMGEYKVRDETLRSYWEQYLHLKRGFATLRVEHIPREKNGLADRLAAEAIESRIDTSLKSG